MLNLFEKINFLENLPLAKVILHVVFLNSFDSHLLTSKLMDTKGYLTKSTLSNQFYKLVEVQCCRRQLIILLNVLFNVLNQLVSLLKDRVIHFCRWLRV
jgi:hypothetical protein